MTQTPIEIFLQELKDTIAGTDKVLQASPELMAQLFSVSGPDTPRHIIVNAAVYWGEQHGFHLTFMPVMDLAEWRDYDELMKKYNPQPQVKAEN